MHFVKGKNGNVVISRDRELQTYAIEYKGVNLCKREVFGYQGISIPESFPCLDKAVGFYCANYENIASIVKQIDAGYTNRELAQDRARLG